MTTLLDNFDEYVLDKLISKCHWNDVVTMVKAELLKDKKYLYAKKVIMNEIINETDMIQLLPTENNDIYDKLFSECKYLKDFPNLKDVIVAGGFINIAIDPTLKYSDFSTSDIDIFICGKDYEKQLKVVLEFFDKMGAKYKKYYDIINVYIPDYSRNFQIICTDKESVFNVITNFHTSNVKCGLYNGKIMITPDCKIALDSKKALINPMNINAYTLSKIIKRGYHPINYEKYEHTPLNNDFHSISSRERLSSEINDAPYVDSKLIMDTCKTCDFKKSVYSPNNDVDSEGYGCVDINTFSECSLSLSETGLVTGEYCVLKYIGNFPYFEKGLVYEVRSPKMICTLLRDNYNPMRYNLKFDTPDILMMLERQIRKCVSSIIPEFEYKFYFGTMASISNNFIKYDGRRFFTEKDIGKKFLCEYHGGIRIFDKTIKWDLTYNPTLTEIISK